jgi:hypothetical protein
MIHNAWQWLKLFFLEIHKWRKSIWPHESISTCTFCLDKTYKWSFLIGIISNYIHQKFGIWEILQIFCMVILGQLILHNRLCDHPWTILETNPKCESKMWEMFILNPMFIFKLFMPLKIQINSKKSGFGRKNQLKTWQHLGQRYMLH